MAGTGEDEGSRGMMGVMVFVGTFVVLLVLFQSMFLAINPGESGGIEDVSSDLQGFDITTLATYTLYNNTSNGNTYNVTDADYGTYLQIPNFKFTEGTLPTDASVSMWWSANTKVFVYPMKDWTYEGVYYGDAFVFWTQYGWFDSRYQIVTQSDILSSLVQYPTYQQAKISVSIGDTYSAFLTFPKEDDASADLNARTGFSIALGQSQIDKARDQNNMVSIVTSMLTLNVQTGNQFLDILIILPMGIAYVWIAVWMITRIIGAFMP